MDAKKHKPSMEELLSAAPTQEATPKPLHSDQKMEELNNLLTRVEVARPYPRELPEAPIIPEGEESGQKDIEEGEQRQTKEVDAQINDLKLRALQSEVNKIILKSKMKFNEDIEAVVRQYADGVGLKVLFKHNDSIQTEAILQADESVQKLHDGESNESEFKKKQHEENMATQKLERERKREGAKKKQQEENRKREQERQKREEENKKEEEARSVMMDCFNIAVTQVRGIFPHSIQLWIDQHLSFSTLNQIETIYAHSFPGTIQEHRKVVKPKLWNEFASLVDRQCKEECLSVLRSISEPLLQFNRAVKKQFDFHGYFNQPELEKMFSDEFQKLQISQDELTGTGHMTKLAIDKLVIIYQHHNEVIIVDEKNYHEIACSQIENLYHEQMKRYMQHSPFNAQTLNTIHKKLLETLVDTFRKACYLSNSASSFLGTIEDPLKEALEKAYKSYETSNYTKLKKLQIETNKIILQSKMTYTENIEAVLKQYPDGVEMKVLTKHNDSIRAVAMKLLEMEIRTKVRDDEPVEIHQKVLENHIENYWPTVLEANLKKSKRKKERDEEEQREQKKAEARRKLQLLQLNEVKKDIEKKIEHTKQFATHAKASMDDIIKQMDTLQRLCDKYENK